MRVSIDRFQDLRILRFVSQRGLFEIGLGPSHCTTTSAQGSKASTWLGFLSLDKDGNRVRSLIAWPFMFTVVLRASS